MKKQFGVLLAILIMACASCTGSGPEETLDKLAGALENNNPTAFLAGIDIQAYSANYIKSMTSAAPALNTLNELGNMLGLGNIDKLIGSVVDVQSRIKNEFERGVATGELMAQCSQTITPDCPWYPESLRDAQVTELSSDAAVAKITTPARITSWLAMRKRGNAWQVAGRAELENTAIEMAQGAAASVTNDGNDQTPESRTTPQKGGYEI